MDRLAKCTRIPAEEHNLRLPRLHDTLFMRTIYCVRLQYTSHICLGDVLVQPKAFSVYVALLTMTSWIDVLARFTPEGSVCLNL